MTNATQGSLLGVLAIAAGLAGSATPARADLQICNRMSYVTQSAIAIEDKAAAASRGWFRVDPGQCRTVAQGALQADRIYIHLRVPALYGPSPLPRASDADFCVTADDFIIAGARKCTRANQKLARFTEVKPSESEQGQRINLAEDFEYSDTQARDAGIQRLLVIAGYDANPIDGIRGAKTDAALVQFLQDNKLNATAAARSDFFDILLDAAQKPGTGFSWCNDTIYTVMAALAAEDKGGVVSRGWYRIEAGKCLRPDIAGRPVKIYSFAEAVDGAGRPIRQGDKTLSWRGDKVMCVSDTKFELSDHEDCAARGLSAAGFAAIDFAGRSTTTLRFK